MTLIDRIENDFTYHPPTGMQVKFLERIRQKAKELAILVATFAPSSREQSTALTKVEEAVMWANAAIVRHEAPEAGA